MNDVLPFDVVRAKKRISVGAMFGQGVVVQFDPDRKHRLIKETVLPLGNIYSNSNREHIIVNFGLNWKHLIEFQGFLNFRYSNEEVKQKSIDNEFWALLPKKDYLFPLALQRCLQAVIALEWTVKLLDEHRYAKLWQKFTK